MAMHQSCQRCGRCVSLSKCVSEQGCRPARFLYRFMSIKTAPPLPPLFPSFAAGSQGGHTLSYDTRCSSTTVCFMHWTCHPHAPCIAVCWVHDCQDGLLWQDKSSPACACACACACVLPKSSSPGKHRHDCCFGMIVTVIHIVISVIPVVGLSTFIIIVLSNYYN